MYQSLCGCNENDVYVIFHHIINKIDLYDICAYFTGNSSWVSVKYLVAAVTKELKSHQHNCMISSNNKSSIDGCDKR